MEKSKIQYLLDKSLGVIMLLVLYLLKFYVKDYDLSFVLTMTFIAAYIGLELVLLYLRRNGRWYDSKTDKSFSKLDKLSIGLVVFLILLIFFKKISAKIALPMAGLVFFINLIFAYREEFKS